MTDPRYIGSYNPGDEGFVKQLCMIEEIFSTTRVDIAPGPGEVREL